ncbi:hypothetical protein Tco_1032350 [Tanacetum coccineum]|uniref:Uncharacterized protein n=1 Tax=Tanacetum coccineum TaxID=301880 RepID=A0ABQ5GCE6_9ASTR
MNHQTSSVPQIAYQSPQVSTQLMTESPLVDSGFAIPVFFLGDDPIACLNKAMTFLIVVASLRGDKVKVILVLGLRVMLLALGETMQADRQGLLSTTTIKEAGKFLDEEQLAFLADLGVLDGQVVQTIIPNNAAFQTDDLDTYDSDCDDISNAQEEKANKEQNNESVTLELKRYKERVKTFEQRLNIDLSSREKMIYSQMDDMIREKLALKEQVDSLEKNLSKQIKEKECLLQTFTVFKNESKEKEDKYMENKIDLDKKIKELDNILFKVGQSAQTVHMLTKPQAFYDNIHKQALEKSRSKMSEKEKDQEIIDKNISHKPIDYEKLNRLSEVFRKHFTPQQEIDAKQAFWLRISNPTSKPSDASPVKIEAPKELPKVSLVNESFKKLKFHLTRFDNVVKIRTTPDARTEGEWGFEHTKAVFNNEIIPFLKSLKDIFNVFCGKLEEGLNSLPLFNLRFMFVCKLRFDFL